VREWSSVVYRKINKPVVDACLSLGISANQVTVLNHFITLTLGCYAFAQGTYIWGLVALGVCLLNGFLDYLDGDLARATGTTGKLGIWLDSGFDVIVQNAVMGAIAIGCHLPIWLVVLFFIGNSANNFVSFNYNARFGFDSDKGNELFRNIMDKKCHPINRILKNIIDPTDNYPSLVFYTFRYWIALGFIFNVMPICFVIVTIISNIKWVIMYSLYALHLMGERRLYVLQALAALDEECGEFYSLRSHV
jgi:hypothetical protein